jgi:hypothetical protein
MNSLYTLRQAWGAFVLGIGVFVLPSGSRSEGAERARAIEGTPDVHISGQIESASGPKVISVRRIWDRGVHNAFTDLIRFRDHWYCAFREGSGHRSDEGKIRVIVSADGETWESAGLLEENGVDLREPKLSVTPDGRLFMVMGGTIWREGKYEGRRPRISFSTDGRAWIQPQPILAPGDWLWRITWFDGMAYGVSFLGGGGSAEPRRAFLYKSADGVAWEQVVALGVPDVSETTLRFLSDGEMIAFCRSSTRGVGTRLGSSRPPYQRWQWKEDRVALGGPNFIILPDGRWVAGSRVVLGEVQGEEGLRMPEVNAPPEAGPSRTALAWLTRERFQPFLILESGGDNSYPGMVWHDAMLWVTYYSSHEGKSNIYLAQVQLPVHPGPSIRDGGAP